MEKDYYQNKKVFYFKNLNPNNNLIDMSKLNIVNKLIIILKIQIFFTQIGAINHKKLFIEE